MNHFGKGPCVAVTLIAPTESLSADIVRESCRVRKTGFTLGSGSRDRASPGRDQ